MKNTTTKVLGWDVPVTDQPETLDECITVAKAAKRDVAEDWLDYIRFHKTNSAARSAVVDALESVLKNERETEMVSSPTKSDPNRKIEKYSEKEQQYKDRVVAQSGKTAAEVWDMIKDTVGSVPFMAEPREGGAGRLAKQDTVSAQTLIDSDKWQTAVTMLEQKNPGLKVEIVDGKPTVESLATALRTNRKRREAEEKAELGLAA